MIQLARPYQWFAAQSDSPAVMHDLAYEGLDAECRQGWHTLPVDPNIQGQTASAPANPNAPQITGMVTEAVSSPSPLMVSLKVRGIGTGLIGHSDTL
jgi:hypothetical protein